MRKIFDAIFNAAPKIHDYALTILETKGSGKANYTLFQKEIYNWNFQENKRAYKLSKGTNRKKRWHSGL